MFAYALTEHVHTVRMEKYNPVVLSSNNQRESLMCTSIYLKPQKNFALRKIGHFGNSW